MPHKPLELPYYGQTAEFSCGPACVLMALAGLSQDKALLNRETEFAIWRRTNLVGVPGADVFTLAQPFVDRDLDVRLYNERLPTFERARVIAYADEEAAELTVFASNTARMALQEASIPVEERAPTVDDVGQALDDGWIPLCLVGMHEVHDEEIPHWVIVLAVDEDEVVFHDPYSATGGPHLRRPRQTFQKMLDDMDAMHCSRGMVLVRERG